MKRTYIAKPLPPEFNALLLPPYQEATHGDWKLFKAPNIRVPVPAYFTHVAMMPAENWVLMKHYTIWMSLTLMEMQSQGHHARLAHGQVVVMGLGMGALVYNLLANPLVTRITVCEREADVVALLQVAAPWFEQAIQSARLEIHIVDAFEYRPRGAMPDVLLADIWSGMGTEQAEPDVLQIWRHVPARTVGWWGQELAAVSWIYSRYDKRNRFPMHRGHVKAYEKYLGFDLVAGNHPQYPAMLKMAATSATLAMKAKSQMPPLEAVLKSLTDQYPGLIEPAIADLLMR